MIQRHPVRGRCALSAVSWRTAPQDHVPAGLQGRVATYTYTAQIALVPAAFTPVGPMLAAMSPAGVQALCAAVIAAASLALLVFGPVRGLTLNLQEPEREMQTGRGEAAYGSVECRFRWQCQRGPRGRGSRLLGVAFLLKGVNLGDGLALTGSSRGMMGHYAAVTIVFRSGGARTLGG